MAGSKVNSKSITLTLRYTACYWTPHESTARLILLVMLYYTLLAHRERGSRK